MCTKLLREAQREYHKEEIASFQAKIEALKKETEAKILQYSTEIAKHGLALEVFNGMTESLSATLVLIEGIR